MKRKEAEALIGKRVSAWTAMNGVYIGTLVSVVGSPWRGMVLITGVAKPAAIEWARGDRQRRGMRPGETIEVGGSSIEPADWDGKSYLDALIEDEALVQAWRERADTPQSTFQFILKHRRQQIDEERRSRGSLASS